MVVGKVFLLLLSVVSQSGPPVPVMAFLDRQACVDFANSIADEAVDDDASLECREATVDIEEKEETGS